MLWFCLLRSMTCPVPVGETASTGRGGNACSSNKLRLPSRCTTRVHALIACSSKKVCLQQGYLHWLHAAQRKCVLHLKVKHGYFYWLHVAHMNVCPSGFLTPSQHQADAPWENCKPIAQRMATQSLNLSQASNPILFHTTLHEYILASTAVWCFCTTLPY